MTNLAQCDVAVVGGGVAAVFCAYALAAEGRRAAILADGGSLLHELGQSRLPLLGTADLAAQHPPVREWVELLSSRGGVKGDEFEPILCQLLADRFVGERGIDVLFEAMPVQAVTDAAGDVVGVEVATREGLQTIPCRAVVDCTESAVLMRRFYPVVPVDDSEIRSIWTLTTLNGDRIREPVKLSCTLRGTRYDIRLAPSYWEGELAIAVAVSSGEEARRGEIGFMAALERLILWLREHAGPDIGDLVHVAERSWSTPAFVLDGEAEAGGWLRACSGRLAGVGVWTPDIAAAVRAAPLWEQGGTALNRLIAQAIAAAAKLDVPQGAPGR